MEEETVQVTKQMNEMKINVVSFENRKETISAEIARIQSTALKVSNTYAEMEVCLLLSTDLTRFSEIGKTIFKLINPRIKKHLADIGTSVPSMEDWRSIPWGKILPDDIPSARINNRAVHMMWISHYSVDKIK